MRKLLLFVGVCFWILAGTALSQSHEQNKPEQPLNSERIFQQFGSYGIELINQEDDFRQTSLYSEDEHGRITRTFATVKFLEPMDSVIEPLHKQILKGASIGSTFKGAGWQINKFGLLVDELVVTPSNQIFGLMRLSRAQPLALHLYLFSVSKENITPSNYALIAELHHPDYLRINQLGEIYNDSMDLPQEGTLKNQINTLLTQINNL